MNFNTLLILLPVVVLCLTNTVVVGEQCCSNCTNPHPSNRIILQFTLSLCGNCSSVSNFRDGEIARVLINNSSMASDITANESPSNPNEVVQYFCIDSYIQSPNTTVQFVWKNVIPTNGTCYWRISNMRIVWRLRNVSTTPKTTVTLGYQCFDICTVANDVYQDICSNSLWACSGCNDSITEQFVSENITFINGTTVGFGNTFQCYDSIFNTHKVNFSNNSTQCNNELVMSSSTTIEPTSSKVFNSSVISCTTIEPTSSEIFSSSMMSSTMNRPSSSQILKKCDEDMDWDRTPAGQNVTVTGGCYNGTVDVTRYCDTTGKWHNSYCLASDRFNEILDEILQSPTDGLMAIRDAITESSTNISLNQLAFLLSKVVNKALNGIENTSLQSFTEVFLYVASDLIIFAQELNEDYKVTIIINI